MMRFVASSLVLAFVALTGLAAYTATHPIDSGVIAVSGASKMGGPVRPASARLPSAPRTKGCRSAAHPPRA